MRKYQWNDIRLKKRAQLCYWLILAFGLVALLMVKVIEDLPTLLLALPGVGILVSFIFFGRFQSQDAKIKRGDRRE